MMVEIIVPLAAFGLCCLLAAVMAFVDRMLRR